MDQVATAQADEKIQDVAQGVIGNTGIAYQINFVSGKLVASASLAGPAVGASLSISVDSDHVLDAIAAAIPGKIDDALIAVIKAALKAVG